MKEWNIRNGHHVGGFDKKCEWCNKDFKAKSRQARFCSKSCAYRFNYKRILEGCRLQNKIRKEKKLKIKLTIERTCEYCGHKFYESNSRRFCSSVCAHAFVSNQNREYKNKKISNGVINWNKKNHHYVGLFDKKCEWCNKNFKSKLRRTRFCSRSCSSHYVNSLPSNKEIFHKNGLNLSLYWKEIKRSKNEIYFAELCAQYFKKVRTNEQIFNGWDADIIIDDIKYAVLWNGKWHYQKIKKNHSVLQVQNRDRIKTNEIKKYGYIPYIIKDMGRYNKKFVENQFNIFKNFISLQRLSSLISF